MELAEEGCFKFTACVVVRSVALEDFVEPFKKKGPETMHRPVISNRIWSISGVVVVRPYDIGPVELWIRCRQLVEDRWTANINAHQQAPDCTLSEVRLPLQSGHQ
jgi:hypothetical protein